MPALCRFAVASLLLFSTAALDAGEQTVRLEMHEDTLTVTIDGAEFATYHFGDELPKPFFADVRAPGGTVVTRTLNDPVDKDHPHHKGIWVAVDEVNEVDFWAEKGKIDNASVKPLVAEGNPAKLQVVNHWLSEDEKPMVTETTIISIYPNRVMAYDITFTAVDRPAEFLDTKEGLFAVRLRKPLTARDGSGTIVGANGETGEKALWGKPNEWIDYYGEAEGRTVGVALFDHPDNLRPSRYHVRGYGLFAISPFGDKAYSGGEEEAKPVHLEVGEKLRLRYGVYIHAGDTHSANVAAVYRDYTDKAK
ncbi:MAG: PmoA family protein [Planctomycetaceae bacterium]